MSKWDCDSKYGTYTKTTDTQSELEEFRENVGFVSAAWGLSKRKTHDKIFELGLERALEETAEHGTVPQFGDKNYEDWIHAVEASNRKKQYKHWTQYRDMEREEGHAYLVEWANEHQIDISDYLEDGERFARQIMEKEQDHPIDSWILEKLADGEKHKTADLRKQAIEDGWGDTPWNTITQRAVRLKVTKVNGNPAGVWQLPQADKAENHRGKILSMTA